MSITFTHRACRSLLAAALFGAALLLSSACGQVELPVCVADASSDAGGEAAAEADLPARDACDALAIAQVDFVRTCSGYEVPRASLAETCRILAALPGSTVGEADLAACTDDIRFGARSCSLPPCVGYGTRAIFPGKMAHWNFSRPAGPEQKTGTLPDRSPCLTDLQCASAECGSSAFQGGPLCGVCQSTKYLDQSCTGPTDTCTTGTTCSDGVCILAGGKVGEPCSNENACQSTLYCKGSVCVSKHTIGEECSPDDPCVEESSYCNWSENRCRPYRTIDQACAGDEACAPGLTCRDQVCIANEQGWLDGPCESGCMEGLLCIDGVCRRLPGTGRAEGEPCLDTFCGAGLLCATPCNGPECDHKPKLCRRFRGGDACASPSQCPEGMMCEHDTFDDQGVCHPLRDVGEPCEDGNRLCHYHLRCVDGLCRTFDASMCR
ncbi:MAG: Thiamin-phosphate pyrophosphorylase [Labilithrix sp.]|nr:Thiamin-phosphate pyrophosphorylase [Labilithrix sp.]